MGAAVASESKSDILVRAIAAEHAAIDHMQEVITDSRRWSHRQKPNALSRIDLMSVRADTAAKISGK